jgi:HK97 family phage portal protein
MLTFLFGAPKRGVSVNDEAAWVSMNRVRTLRKTTAGIRVDEELGLEYSAVWCATRILIEAVAGLPLITYKRDGESREPAPELRVYDICKTMPNEDMDAVAFREGRTGHQINWGNGFAEIERNLRTGEPLALWPIHAGRVNATTKYDTEEFETYPYKVRNDDGSFALMRRSELLHIPGVFPEDGHWGKGVIEYARESIGGALAVDRHGYAYFGSGAQPKALIKLPASMINDPEKRKLWRKEWNEIHSAPDSSEVAILPPDGEYQHISITNEDSQFLETRKFSVSDIARWYRLPAHMLGEYEKAASYASVEMQGIEFVTYSLMPWLRKWEGQLNLKLLTPEQRGQYFIEHQLAGLLRGDLKSRMESYRTALNIGLMTVNECRRLENLPSIGPKGDLNLVQSNMTTLEFLHETGGAGVASIKAAPPPMDEEPEDEPDGEDGPIDEPDGGTEGAFDQWTRRSALVIANGHTPRRQSRTAALPPVATASDAMRAAAKRVMEDALSRTFRKEANFVLRELNSPDVKRRASLPQWLPTFYGRHRGVIASAIRPAAEMLTAIGVPCDADQIAEDIAKLNQAELTDAMDNETPKQMTARLETWPDQRPAWILDHALAGVI